MSKHVELRRKNMGNQYVVVDPDSRYVLHWIRPGDRLPQYVATYPNIFEVTQEDIQKAFALQRVKLYPVDDSAGFHPYQTQANANGTTVAFKASLWERVKRWARKQINKLKGVFK